MKKGWMIAKALFAMMISSFVVSGCSDFISEMGSESVSVAQKFGSIVIGYDDINRAADVMSIETAKIVVSGSGIVSGAEPSSTAVVESSMVKKAVVNNIPYGKNRIVTVYAYNGEAVNEKLISEIKLRGVVDIDGTGIEVVIDSTTTALGNVFNKLFEDGINISAIDKSVIEEKIKAGVHYALINTDQIAEDYKNNTLKNHTADDYVIAAGSINFDYYFENGYTVQIDDPLSEPKKNVAAGPDVTVYNIAPGTWTVKLIKDGQVVESVSVTVEAGQQKTMGVLPCKNKVAVVYKDENSVSNKLYAWASGSNVLTAAYPGDSCTKIGNYYVWTYSDLSSFNVKVSGLTSDVSLVSGYGVYVLTSGCSGNLTKEDEYESDGPIIVNPPVVQVVRNDKKIIITSDSDLTSSNVKVKSGTKEITAVFNGRTSTVDFESWSLSNGDIITVTGSVSNAGGSTEINKSFTYTENSADSITVHAKQKYIYYWVEGGTAQNVEMTQEGSWYSYTIPLTSVKIIFKDDSGWTNQTSNLSLTGAGEYWYKNGTWYNSNPEDSVAPVLVSFVSDASGVVSGNVTFTISATDNTALKTAVLTCDGKSLASVSLSGTEAAASYIFETAKLKNGAHTIVCIVKDDAGNSSEEKQIIVTTQNVNLPPVAVITGSRKVACDKTVKFTANNSYDQNEGTIASYKWTVTGSGATVLSGLTSSELSVKTASSADMTFTVTLVVTDDQGASSAVETLDVVTAAVDANWDFRDETIYFLMTTRFYDGDSSNNRYCWGDEEHLKSKTNNDPGWRGDFKGLIDKLDYIKALGFTAIWITPVVENASGLDYHGYHAYDFSKVDPRYESAGATYQDLIDAAHSKGIKIIQDIVLNHCSNQGERNLLPMTEKFYDTDNGEDSVAMGAVHDAKDIYGRNTYDLLNAGVKSLTDNQYNTYEELEADAKQLYNDAKRGSLLYESRIYSMNNGLAIDNDEAGKLFHYQPRFEWENTNLQTGTMAGDCVDLNTENPKVAEYLRDCYIKYINMGVDAFRIDTLKHISRLTMNKEFIPQFHEAAKAMGNEKFFMFGEACVKRNEVWNGSLPPISVAFYTWNQNDHKTDASYAWKGVSDYVAAAKDNLTMIDTFNDDNDIPSQLTSNNVFLNGNLYHEPDYSKYSGLSVIDFYMHHKFKDAGNAIDAARQEDNYFNDSSWAVTYVDSHDFGPNEGGMLLKRFNLGTAAWAENLDLMFTFRGIPCVYYGSEIEFQAGAQIEPWCDSGKVPYNQSGRAYFGDHLEGSCTSNGVGEYTASGEIKNTLDYSLSQHIMRLNQIRAAVPALRKGQYSFENCNGSNAFKRRYTKNGVDSFVVVSISGSATFTGLPAGKYIDVVSGDVQTIGEGGTITSKNSGQGSMAVYVNATLDPSITGPIGKTGTYLK